MTKILVVDDDPHLREVVRFALEAASFVVEEAGDGRAALDRFADVGPDLVVLDVMLPELDGVEVCRRLRATSRVPVVFLTSRSDEIDRVVGLEIGGDDYVTKPFSPRELVARVRAVLRRVDDAPQPSGAVEPVADAAWAIGRLRLDPERHRAFWDGTEVVLTGKEFALLRTLAARPGIVFSRDRLMAGAYGDDTVVSDRTIDSHVRRLRSKFAAVGGEPVETVHGVGYRLGECRARS